MRPQPFVRLGAGLVLALCIFSTPAGAVDDFNVFLRPGLPDTAFVGLGDVLEITLEVDSTAQQFNAYQIELQFDPAVITAVEVLEGPLFTEACPTRYAQSEIGDSTVIFYHVILCAGVSVDGPGVLSTFRFQTQQYGVSPVTIISEPDESFYDAGYIIWPEHPTFPRQVVFHHAVAKVVDPASDVREGSSDQWASALELRVQPNPIRGPARILAHRRDSRPGESREACPARFEVFDAGGRLLWHRRGLLPPGGELCLPWPAPGPDGPAAAGTVYFCRLTAAGATRTVRVQVIR